MKLVLVVIGDGRGDFLVQAVRGVKDNVTHGFSARIMVDDSGDPRYGEKLDIIYPEFDIIHGGRRGMAGAVQAGFDAALAYGPDYVLWIEEDMLLTRPVPVADAIAAMEWLPGRLAQIAFKREPWWGSPDEMRHGDQLAAIVELAPNSGTTATHTWHDYLFTLNPSVIPRRVLELGWPSGPLGVGNESGMTRRCLDAGYVFGSWGHVGDEPWATHIGAYRTAAWML